MIRNNLTFLILFFVALFLFAFGIYSFRYDIDYPRKHVKINTEIEKFSKELSFIWRNGDTRGWLDNADHCQDVRASLENYGQHTLQCNPRLMSCLLENENFVQSFFGDRDLRFRMTPIHFTSHPEVQTSGQLLNIEFLNLGNESRFSLVLPSLCHEVRVRSRRYPLDASRDDRISSWDNFGQNVFVDKYQVRVQDLKIWKELADEESLRNRIDQLVAGRSEYEVVGELNSDEMHSYCQFFGKQVLSSHVLDAMSLHPVDLDQDRPERFILAPYPWSIRRDDGFLYEFSQGREEEVSSEECQRAMTLECYEKWPELQSHPLSPTWSGIFQVLGGIPEYVVNIQRPRENLRASAFYFKSKSRWHRLGTRAYWDGEGHSYRNFNWRLEQPDERDHFPVAFRCMRYRETF